MVVGSNALVPDNPKDYDNDTFDNDRANGITDHDNHKDKYFFQLDSDKEWPGLTVVVGSSAG